MGLVTLGTAVVSPPLYGQEVPFESKAMARRLATIEETNPHRIRELMRNGQPTLIAFIDHFWYTCLRPVGPIEQLRREFSDRANVIVIDSSRTTAAHSWAKDHYRVRFVPKFVIVDKGGNVAREYFGPMPSQTLVSNLQNLLAQ